MVVTSSAPGGTLKCNTRFSPSFRAGRCRVAAWHMVNSVQDCFFHDLVQSTALWHVGMLPVLQ